MEQFLELKDVRSFRGTHKIPVSRLNIIVGENSSGKSTMLGAVQMLFENFMRFPEVNLITGPYNWGNVAAVSAHLDNPRQGFSIGMSGLRLTGDDPYRVKISWMGTTRRDLGRRLELEAASGVKMIVQRASQEEYTVSVLSGGRSMTNKRIPRGLISQMHLPVALAIAVSSIEKKGDKSSTKARVSDVASPLFNALGNFANYEPLSLAPVRSRPDRHFRRGEADQFDEGASALESLDRMLHRSTARVRKNVTTYLGRFGKSSGMFDKISTLPIGREGMDPVRVVVTRGGRSFDLVDVGYGVSQILPVLLYAWLHGSQRPVMIQQPEVHLHPAAQAALGTLIVDLMNSDPFMGLYLETHSDFLIDRIRLGVREKRIKKEDVAIIYVELTAQGSRHHRLELDDNGDYTKLPASYRRFFFNESLRMLGG